MDCSRISMERLEHETVAYLLRWRCYGQSSVEYAIVFAAFLAMILGLGVIANFLESGLVLEHALQSASHHLKDAVTAAWADVLLY